MGLPVHISVFNMDSAFCYKSYRSHTSTQPAFQATLLIGTAMLSNILKPYICVYMCIAFPGGSAGEESTPMQETPL